MIIRSPPKNKKVNNLCCDAMNSDKKEKEYGENDN